MHPKSFKSIFKLNSYLMSICHCWLVNLSKPIFLNSDLTKNEIYFLFQKSMKNGCNNLYFYPYTFDMNHKSFFIWHHFPIMARKVLKPQLLAILIWQKQWQIYLLLGNLIRNNRIYLFLYPKLLKIILKSNSYLTPFFLRLDKSVKPQFSQYKSYKNNGKSTCSFRNH